MSFNEQNNSREQSGKRNNAQQKQQKSGKPTEQANNQPESYEL